MPARTSSRGVVRSIDPAVKPAGVTVLIQHSEETPYDCEKAVLDTDRVRTEADGSFYAPSRWPLQLLWLLPHMSGGCQRYAIEGQRDMKPIGPLGRFGQVGRSRGQEFELSVWEGPSRPPRLRLIAALLGSSDEYFSAQLGGALTIEERFLNLGVRVVGQAGVRGGSVAIGLRAGMIFRVDLSARLAHIWSGYEEGNRMGPELGFDFLLLRLAGGLLFQRAGHPPRLFISGGWNVVF